MLALHEKVVLEVQRQSDVLEMRTQRGVLEKMIMRKA